MAVDRPGKPRAFLPVLYGYLSRNALTAFMLVGGYGSTAMLRWLGYLGLACAIWKLPGAAVAALARVPLFWLIVAYLCYTWLNGFRDQTTPTWMPVMEMRTPVFAMALTVYCSAMARNPRDLERQIRLFVIASCILAIAAILHFLLFSDDPEFGHRLVGFYAGRNPILFGFVISITVIGFAVHLADFATPRRAAMTVCVLSGGIAVLFLTEARGAMIGTAAVCLLMLTRPHWKQATIWTSLLFVSGAALATHWTGGTFASEALWTRVSNWRFEIWADGWNQIMEAPFFGHGTAAVRQFAAGVAPHQPEGWTSTHSVLLGELYHGGIVGTAILLTMWGMAVKEGLAANKSGKLGQFAFSLLVFGSIVCLFEFHTLFRAPALQWLVSWLPICLIAGMTAAGVENATARPNANEALRRPSRLAGD